MNYGGIKVLEKCKRFFNKYVLLYGINVGAIIIGVMAIGILKSYMPPYKVDYEPENIQNTMENSGTMNTVFHYYLDFSPSMEGFFQEDIGGGMKSIVEILSEINTSGNEKEFFCCADRIESVNEETWYNNMESVAGIRTYYDDIVYDMGTDIEGDININNEDLESAINSINLAGIFNLQYGENQQYETGEESLNVIITDLNFKKNVDDIEGHTRLMNYFAENLGETCADSNVVIYRISSNFAGIESDEYELEAEYGMDEEVHSFFIIVESKNDSAYVDFTDKLETKLNDKGINYSEKYELVNKISEGNTVLSISLDTLKRNNWIKVENFNFDNNSFENLKDNELGFGIVQGNGVAYLNMRTSPIEVIGSNHAEQVKTGDVQIDTKTKVSYLSNEKDFEELEAEIISSLKCGTVWEQEEMYLAVELEMDPNVVLSELESVRKDSLLQKRFFIIELQCFLEKPDYTLPKWLVDNEEMQDKIEVYNSVMENKELEFSNLPEEQRYLGSIVLYITY